MVQLDMDRLLHLFQQHKDKSTLEVLDMWRDEYNQAMQEYEAQLKAMAATTTTRQWTPPPPPPQWVQEMRQAREARDRIEDAALEAWSRRKAKEDQARYSAGTFKSNQVARSEERY